MYVHEMHVRQGKQKLPALPLDPMIVQAPFQQWELDFIGQFNQSSSQGYNWIPTTTNYFTRWEEDVPLKTSSPAIVRFLEYIVTRFGVPQKINIDNATVFRSIELMAFCSWYNFILAHSTNYYPQGNGLVESSNKNLIPPFPFDILSSLPYPLHTFKPPNCRSTFFDVGIHTTVVKQRWRTLKKQQKNNENTT